jgi:transformation/transcription domain-associated protein
VNRLAAIARKHDCPEVCKNIIATQYGFNAMEVQEAFVKIREQAQAFLEQPDQLIAGLNLLSGQNLDYFQTPHQVHPHKSSHQSLLAGTETVLGHWPAEMAAC